MNEDNPPAEEWRAVPGHPKYEVSSLGRVRSGFTRILKGWIDPAGYHRVTLAQRGHRYIHQIAAEAFIGPRPEGKEVDHINNIRGDNRAENLRYLTRQENLERREGARASECGQGHPFSGDNLYIRPSNGRQECRECGRQRLKNRPPSLRVCSEEGCTRDADCRLLTDHPVCEMHYQRARRAEKRRQAA